MNEINEYTEKIFEDIKHIDENGNEYWLARELMPLLEYTEWRKFKGVINRAIIVYMFNIFKNFFCIFFYFIHYIIFLPMDYKSQFLIYYF